MDRLERMVLAALLYERLDSAVHVRQCGDRIDGWRPRAGLCHENVVEWVKRNPDHRPVRGWLYAPYLTTENIARFLSHSIIETEPGELMDITLASTEWAHPFIRHIGSEEEFLKLVHNNGAPWIDHRKNPEAEYLCSDEEDLWSPDLPGNCSDGEKSI
jgi:hypothetical protein